MSEDGARPAIALGLREIGEYLIALAEAEEHAEIPEHRKLAKAPSNILDTDRLRKLAELLLKMRRSRSEWLDGDLFAEPAWDILLGSFVARTSGVVQLTKVATNWSNVPTTTSLRWIEVLRKQGLVTRSNNSADARYRVISLTDFGYAQMTEVLRVIDRSITAFHFELGARQAWLEESQG